MADTTTLLPLSAADRTALDPRSDRDILEEALARFAQAAAAEHAERAQQLDAVHFHAGDPRAAGWRLRGAPADAPSPPLHVDRQSAYVYQVVNSYRKNPLGVRVRPRSGGASKATAEVLEGKIREIESTSEADQAYGKALEWAAAYGLGYLRLCTAWTDHTSFEQTLEIKPIPNRFSVYVDPSSVHPAGLDMNWCLVVERMSRTAFMTRYDRQPPPTAAWQGTGDAAWYDAETVLVADYLYRVWETVDLVQLPDGRVLPGAGLTDLDPTWPTRRAQRPTVYWVQLCGHAVLAKHRWLGQYCPVIRVEGNRIDVDGRIQRTGIIQQTMSAQLAYDYAFSAEIEAIALSPKAPYIVAVKQLSGYEEYWNRANDQFLPYLPYTPLEGVPPPQRQVVEPAIQALALARQQAAADMQAALGMFQASLGEESNEKSGVAIRSRKIEGDQATYHYPANLAWAIRAVGIQIVDILPHLYSGPTTLRHLARDGSVKMTPVNQRVQNAQGQVEEHLLARGQYDVVVDAGPSYSTQREMAADKLAQLGAVLPQEMLPMIADLWAGQLDIPASEEIAARLRTAVPPQALEATQESNPENKVAALQHQLQQLTVQTQMIAQQLQEAKQTEEVATQSVKLLEQQVAVMQARLADKQTENQLQAQKQQMDYDIDRGKLALEAQKLGLQAEQVMNGQVYERPE